MPQRNELSIVLAGQLSSAYEAALCLTEQGFKVLPLYGLADQGCQCGSPSCSHSGKHPRTRHGEKDASANPLDVAAWNLEVPGSNYGLSVGTDSGILVIDIDPRNGDGLQDLVNRFGELPETFTVLTGRQGEERGRHLYYRFPGAGLMTGVLAPGVDLKASGYVLIPGCLHPSGVRYEVLSDCPALLASLPPAWEEFCIRACASARAERKPRPSKRGYAPMKSSAISQNQENRGNTEQAKLAGRARQLHLQRIRTNWSLKTIEPGQSLIALRQLAGSLAYCCATLEEAEQLTSEVLDRLTEHGAWLCERSPEEFQAGVLEYFQTLPPGVERLELLVYEGELEYLQGLKLPERYFVYLAIISQRIAESRGERHFPWPLKIAARYLELVPDNKRSFTQLRMQVRYLTGNAYNPLSRRYRAGGARILCDRILGNHRQNPAYTGGPQSANMYRFGDDYALATGQRISQEEAEERLDLAPITPMTWTELAAKNKRAVN